MAPLETITQRARLSLFRYRGSDEYTTASEIMLQSATALGLELLMLRRLLGSAHCLIKGWLAPSAIKNTLSVSLMPLPAGYVLVPPHVTALHVAQQRFVFERKNQ